MDVRPIDANALIEDAAEYRCGLHGVRREAVEKAVHREMIGTYSHTGERGGGLVPDWKQKQGIYGLSLDAAARSAEGGTTIVGDLIAICAVMLLVLLVSLALVFPIR